MGAATAFSNCSWPAFNACGRWTGEAERSVMTVWQVWP